MLSKERKFQKMLDLYTQVIESGSTWGITSYEDVLRNKRLSSMTESKGTPDDKYIQRQNVSTANQNHDYHYSRNKLSGINQANVAPIDFDDSYTNVKSGSKPKNEIKLQLKKVTN